MFLYLRSFFRFVFGFSASVGLSQDINHDNDITPLLILVMNTGALLLYTQAFMALKIQSRVTIYNKCSRYMFALMIHHFDPSRPGVYVQILFTGPLHIL